MRLGVGADGRGDTRRARWLVCSVSREAGRLTCRRLFERIAADPVRRGRRARAALGSIGPGSTAAGVADVPPARGSLRLVVVHATASARATATAAAVAGVPVRRPARAGPTDTGASAGASSVISITTGLSRSEGTVAPQSSKVRKPPRAIWRHSHSPRLSPGSPRFSCGTCRDAGDRVEDRRPPRVRRAVDRADEIRSGRLSLNNLDKPCGQQVLEHMLNRIELEPEIPNQLLQAARPSRA